jgi:hypothetical protein
VLSFVHHGVLSSISDDEAQQSCTRGKGWSVIVLVYIVSKVVQKKYEGENG